MYIAFGYPTQQHFINKNATFCDFTQYQYTMSHLLNKDLAEIDFNDIEELFAKLTPEEIQLLSDEVDPDV